MLPVPGIGIWSCPCVAPPGSNSHWRMNTCGIGAASGVGSPERAFLFGTVGGVNAFNLRTRLVRGAVLAAVIMPMAAALTVPAHALPARPPQATHVRAEPEPCYTLSGLDRKLQPILDKLRAAPDHAAAQAAATDYATAVKGFSELCSEGNDHPVADLATVLRHVVDAFHSYSEGCGIDCQTTEWIDKGDDPTARFLTVVLGNMGGMYSVTAKSVAVQADAYPKVLDLKWTGTDFVLTKEQ